MDKDGIRHMADSANQWNKQQTTVQNINGVVQRLIKTI